jgi:hypothetical protein
MLDYFEKSSYFQLRAKRKIMSIQMTTCFICAICGAPEQLTYTPERYRARPVLCQSCQAKSEEQLKNDFSPNENTVDYLLFLDGSYVCVHREVLRYLNKPMPTDASQKKQYIQMRMRLIDAGRLVGMRPTDCTHPEIALEELNSAVRRYAGEDKTEEERIISLRIHANTADGYLRLPLHPSHTIHLHWKQEMRTSYSLSPPYLGYLRWALCVLKNETIPEEEYAHWDEVSQQVARALQRRYDKSKKGSASLVVARWLDDLLRSSGDDRIGKQILRWTPEPMTVYKQEDFVDSLTNVLGDHHTNIPWITFPI